MRMGKQSQDWLVLRYMRKAVRRIFACQARFVIVNECFTDLEIDTHFPSGAVRRDHGTGD